MREEEIQIVAMDSEELEAEVEGEAAAEETLEIEDLEIHAGAHSRVETAEEMEMVKRAVEEEDFAEILVENVLETMTAIVQT